MGPAPHIVSNAERGCHEPHRSSKKLIAQALELYPGELWPTDEGA
jgi:lambda repressor-like predicted transcriptional regulator